MRLRGSTFTAALATAGASLLLAACGGDESRTASTSTAGTESREEAVRKVTRSFITALSAGESGTAEQREAACASLSTRARDKLVAVGQRFGASDCPQTMARIGTAAGPGQYAKAQSTPIEVKVTGDTATASYAAPLDGDLTTVTLGRLGNIWVIQDLPTSGSSGSTTTSTTPTAATVTPSAAPPANQSPAKTLALQVPTKVLPYCKPVTDLPPGVTAGLTCVPFTKTTVDYALVEDQAALSRIYADARDGGPPRAADSAVAGQACREPGRREGRFTNKEFGIKQGRVRCWTLSDGQPRFQWYAHGAPGSPIIFAEATESDKVWGSLYRVWAENAGPEITLN